MGHSEAEVRCKAYELWEMRGRGSGHDRDDWYAAELVVELEHACQRKMRPPVFHAVSPGEIQNQVEISHAGIHDYFYPANTWIETTVDLQTVFEFDSNRRLHFDEGFLNAARRVAMDLSVTSIGEDSHFPYRDLPAFRRKIGEFTALYQSGTNLPPPLFYYPAQGQLEILDGVHRSVAAYEVMGHSALPTFHVWLGFNVNLFGAELVVQQLWTSSMRRLRAGR